MLALWVYLIYATILVSFLPVYRFRNTPYFIFFLTCAFMDPAIILISYLFQTHTYYFLPFVTGIMLLALPGIKWKKLIVFLIFTTIILSTLFKEHNWLPLLISSLGSFYMLFHFSEIITGEYKSSSSVTLFISVLWMESLKDVVKVYLYYRHQVLFTQLYTLFLIVALILPLLVAYFGENKKYIFKNAAKNIFADSYGEHIIGNGSPATVFKNELSSSFKGRELEILFYLSQGLNEQQVADKMFLHKKTIYKYISTLKEKLNLETTQALSRYAFQKEEKLKEIFAINNHQTLQH